MKYEIKEVGYEEQLLIEVEHNGFTKTYAVVIDHDSSGEVRGIRINGKEIGIMELRVIEILLKEKKI